MGRLSSGPGGSYTYGDPAHVHAATAIGSTWSAGYDAAGEMTCRAASLGSSCSGQATGAVLEWSPDGELAGWQDAPQSPAASQDSLSGLVLDGARWYDPVAGQFVSPDGVRPGGGYDPLGLSRYAYVEGNPIDRTDPTGHWSLGGIWSAVTHTVSRAVGAAGGEHRDLVGLPGGAAGGAGGGEHGPDGGVVGVERGVAGGLVGTGEGPGVPGPGAAAGAGAGEPGWGEPALQVRGAEAVGWGVDPGGGAERGDDDRRAHPASDLRGGVQPRSGRGGDPDRPHPRALGSDQHGLRRRLGVGPTGSGSAGGPQKYPDAGRPADRDAGRGQRRP